MVDADSFKPPPELRMGRRVVREHYNQSGMIIFRELVSVWLIDDKARVLKFEWNNREISE